MGISRVKSEEGSFRIIQFNVYISYPIPSMYVIFTYI